MVSILRNGYYCMPKSFRLGELPYPTLTPFSFAVQRDEDRELVGKNIPPRKHHCDQNSIAIILELHLVNIVKKVTHKLWLQYTQILSNY